MARWAYYEGASGRRYCWGIRPTFTCMLASIAEPWPDELEDAAGILACEPLALAAALARAHERAGGRLREDGRLTDLCAACGRKMQREGFRAWVEEDVPPSEYDEDQERNARIAARLGGSPPTRIVGEVRWFDTKREALGWAWEERQIDHARAAEARG